MDSSSEGNGTPELKFRIFDGTDIGHGTYSLSIAAATLKQKLLSLWPRDKSVVPQSASDIKVIHGGKVLENGKTLADSGLHVGSEAITMHVVVQPSVAKQKKDAMETLGANSAANDAENCDEGGVRREDFGALQHGCEHYRRRCKLRAPCCDQIFTCRHCHNEATSTLINPKDRHEIVRHEVKQVVCAICNTEQQVSNLCTNCGVKFGEYFCDICKFYDDDISKEQFHCDDCGICRVGGREKFFHCPKCGSCYSVGLRNNHKCVENSMKNHCPICYEFLFDSTKQTRIMECGHTMHVECYSEMFNQNQYRCPICSKSLFNMSSTWERIDQEIASTAMPEEYRYEVENLCNDCNNTSKTFFHIFGHKCQHCNSYNTRVIASGENQQP